MIEQSQNHITPASGSHRDPAKQLLTPNTSWSLDKEYPNDYYYDENHVASGDNSRPEQGWTEKTYEGDSTAGGAVRNVLLSGSYGELKKLRVDSEVNAETISTSWSASIGENLRVGNNTAVAGYVQLGSTESLVTGSSEPGQDPTPGFAPNDEGIDDLRLIVSDSALIQKDLYVKENSSISGNLDVQGDAHFSGSTSFDGDLQVAGNAGISGTLKVSGSAHFYDDVTGAHSGSFENLVVKENLQVQGSSSLRDTVILGNLQVDGTASYMNVEDLYVKDKAITLASGSTDPNQADRGGIIIDGADVEFLYNAQTDHMTLNKGLEISGNISASNGNFENIHVDNNIDGNTLYVSSSSNLGYVQIRDGLEVSGNIEAPNSNVHVNNVSASFYYGDGRYLINLTASVASSSTWKSYVDFEAGATQRVTHPFHTTDVFVQVYRWDDPDFHPNLASGSSFSSPATRVNEAVVKIIEDGVVDISNDTAVNGYVVISDAGMMITSSVDLLQVATDTASYSNVDAYSIYRFEHKLGTQNVIVSVYQNADIKDGAGTIAPVQIFPEQISIPDKNHVDIVFGRQGISGYIVIAKAGHVIKTFDIGDFINTYNIHYGTEGDWHAHSFTADSISAETIRAQRYVDTPRVGNLDTNQHYYYVSCSWGSYTEYTDVGIDEYVRNSLEDADVRQVSHIDKEGNLTIRGNITTNGSFTTSDIRKKDIIGNVENALDGLQKINGVRFNWKNSGQPSIGVVAQEINAIYPELTKIVPDFNGQEQMVVNYEGLVGVLIEAVKELNSKVKDLEDKLKNENR